VYVIADDTRRRIWNSTLTIAISSLHGYMRIESRMSYKTMTY
jgi:hypothetical protein